MCLSECLWGPQSQPGNSPDPLPWEHTLRQGLKTDSWICFRKPTLSYGQSVVVKVAMSGFVGVLLIYVFSLLYNLKTQLS